MPASPSAPAAATTNGAPGTAIPVAPGPGAMTLPYYFPPGTFPVGLGQLIPSIIHSVQQDVALLTAVPLDARRQQFTQRLANLKDLGALNDTDVTTLQGLADSPDAVTAPSPLLTLEGAPNLCGFIANGMRQPLSFQDSSSSDRAVTIFCAIVGGAAIGCALSGGSMAGAAFGAALAVDIAIVALQ